MSTRVWWDFELCQGRDEADWHARQKSNVLWKAGAHTQKSSVDNWGTDMIFIFVKYCLVADFFCFDFNWQDFVQLLFQTKKKQGTFSHFLYNEFFTRNYNRT